MKKTLLIILAIITMMTSMSIPTFCDDEYDDPPVGETLDPTITADSLDDFSEKLQNLKADEMMVFYYNFPIPGTYEKVLDRIASGKDVVYVPDIGSDEMEFSMFIMNYNADYKNGIRQKYSIAVHDTGEIGLNTACEFTYNNLNCILRYDDGDFIANKEITLYDKKVLYRTSDKGITLFFELDGEKLGLYIGKNMTEDEIKALPKGMFYPRVISIADIKNGNYTNSVELIVDDPKESHDVECII